MTCGLQYQLLLEGEADVLDLQIALTVVDIYYSLANLIGLEDVLLESSIDAGDTLAHAAPSGDIVLISVRDVLLVRVAHLSHDEDLLVPHHFLAVLIDHGGLDCVLYLAFRLLLVVLVDKLEA
jgi:hypothetical protein